MTVYTNQGKDASIAALEPARVLDGNFIFFYADPAKKDEVKQFITSKEIGQEVLAEVPVNGQVAFVTCGEKSREEVMQALKNRGDELAIPEPERKFNAWKWRGWFSNIGQSLNLISGYRKPGGLDVPKITFAGLNFAASYVNATFGGQKSEDEYQLLYLKEAITDLLGKHLPEGVEPPPPGDNRAERRKEPKPPPTAGERIHDAVEGNSVRLGEIGLRYFGSIALAFPLKNWKGAAAKLRAGSLAEAFTAASNKDRTNFLTGVTYLTGKTIGLFSKVPDPYNPKPHTTLDEIREKYLFRLSSTIEAGAAATLAYGNFKPKKGKPDMIGSAGGAVLTVGLLTRLFADFGTRKVDMDELYAHTTDILADVPHKELPQLIAAAAAKFTEHFKEQKPDFGKVYMRMVTDLYRYHRVAPLAASLEAEGPGAAAAKVAELAPTSVTRVEALAASGEAPRQSAYVAV